MRILYLNACGQIGGSESSLLELMAGVRAAQPDWDLALALGEDGPVRGRAQALGVQVMVAPFPKMLARLGDATANPAAALWSLLQASGAAASYARELAQIVRAVQPDLIHSNGFKMHLLSVWASKDIPVLWHVHDYVRARPVMRRLLRWHAGHCAGAIANSWSVAADVRAVMPKLSVAPIYNAIDLTTFTPSGNELDLDALAGLPAPPEGTLRVGLVGVFARWKGHKVFLEALARVPAELPWRAYIVGGPIYQTDGSQWSRGELAEEVKRLNLSGRVGFTGFQDDVASALRALDIVVHASTRPEPFGMVIIEGMACGKAVIASNCGGASELVSDGVNALVHAPGDAAALGERISRLILNHDLRLRLGKTARATAERLYHRARLSTEIVSLYRRTAFHPGNGIPAGEERRTHAL